MFRRSGYRFANKNMRHSIRADVAALGVFEHGAAQRDPGVGGEEAHRDRLIPLQGDDERLAVLGNLALHEAHVLDIEAAPHQALERLLLLGGAWRYARRAQQRSADDQRPHDNPSSMTTPWSRQPSLRD